MAEITKAEVSEHIQTRIRNKTQKGSITKDDIADTLEEILGLINICNCPYINNDDMRTIPFTFHSLGTLRELPTVRQENNTDIPMYCYASQSGTYMTEDKGQSFVVAEGEKAMIIYNNGKWEKITAEELAQDITKESKDTAVSQYLAKKIYNTLLGKIEAAEKKIPSDYLTNESLKDTATQEDLAKLRKDLEADIDEVMQARQIYSAEQLVGADGRNTVFVTSKKYVSGSTRVYLNGQRYFNGISYNEQNDNKTIKITDTLPEKDDIIVVEAIFLPEETEENTEE